MQFVVLFDVKKMKHPSPKEIETTRERERKTKKSNINNKSVSIVSA